MLQSMLDVLTLRVLRYGRLNSWDIMQRIQLVYDDILNVTPGSLYRHSADWKPEGWIPQSEDRQRTTGGRNSIS